MSAWPDLDYASSRDTLQTLQLWTQIVGKIRLAQTPWLNHSWQVPLYVNPRGIGTTGIPYGDELFDIDIDLIDHRAIVRTSVGGTAGFPLPGLCVADFHDRLFAVLADLGIRVTIDPTPQELADTTPLDRDRAHTAYDETSAHAYWRALVQADRVLKRFRTGFVGKASPVHLFWGAFDLATTRFSGRPAPLHAGMPGLNPGDAGSLFARGQQRGLLARVRRLSPRRLLFLCVPRAPWVLRRRRPTRCGLRHRHGRVRAAV